MRTALVSLGLMAGVLGVASHADAGPVQPHVIICALYGAGFHYIPGTDICTNTQTGDTRQQTVGGT